MESLTGTPQTRRMPAIPGQTLIVGNVLFEGISGAWGLSGAVVGGTQLPNRGHQGAHMFRVHPGVDAMAQVEYMA